MSCHGGHVKEPSIPGGPVRKRLIEADARRFGSYKAEPQGREVAILGGNRGTYIATDTRALVRPQGLNSVNTPVCSPQRNGMDAASSTLQARLCGVH